MHEDLKALLRAGWSVGLRMDGDSFRATAKLGEEVARASAPEPLEAVARVIIEVQILEAAK
jgi:hypothetical protein